MNPQERRSIGAVFAAALVFYAVCWMTLYLVFAFDRHAAGFYGESASSGSTVQAPEMPDHQPARQPGSPSRSPQRVAQKSGPSRMELPSEQEPEDTEPIEQAEGLDAKKTTESPGREALAQQVPPGETPLGVQTDKGLSVKKCWDKNGLEHPGEKCDRPRGLDERFKERLYVIERCRQQTAGSLSFGALDLGVEVDFKIRSISFWNGPESDVRGASQILECIRAELAGLPLEEINPGFARYHASLVVRFYRPQLERPVAIPKREESMEDLVNNGRIVNVVRTRVRVRKAPVDGEILGMISTPDRVTLLEQDGDWCRVVTPRKNIGWMVCWGLDLGQGTQQPR